MVVHVWNAATAARRVDRVIVATDDQRIADAVRGAGGEPMLTSPTAASGTDRVAEVARRVPADVYVNVQGDEPSCRPRTSTACWHAARLARSTHRDPVLPWRRPRRTTRTRSGRGRAGRACAVFLALPDPLLSEREPAYRHLGIYAFLGETLHELAFCLPRRSSGPSPSSSCGGWRRGTRSGWETPWPTRSESTPHRIWKRPKGPGRRR
jgi:3-deoxy-manno-octulosonate cytidylyltransferase (CMP-KDO synthetase)